jgi:hypothetical protein
MLKHFAVAVVAVLFSCGVSYAETASVVSALESLPANLKPEKGQSKVMKGQQTEWYEKNKTGNSVSGSAVLKWSAKSGDQYNVRLTMDKVRLFGRTCSIIIRGSLAGDGVASFSKVKEGQAVTISGEFQTAGISTNSDIFVIDLHLKNIRKAD